MSKCPHHHFQIFHFQVQTLNFLKTWTELKEASDMMITRDMFEDALKDLSDENKITLTGRATIRINHH
jgi:DNA replication licensing factor MCM4